MSDAIPKALVDALRQSCCGDNGACNAPSCFERTLACKALFENHCVGWQAALREMVTWGHRLGSYVFVVGESIAAHAESLMVGERK